MTPTVSIDRYPFLRGGGQMGALIRAYDWDTTPLGLPDTWPSSLRTSVSTMLHAGLPMLVLWGPSLICLYNDAVIPSLDSVTQHPAIGKPSAQIWPQAWPVISPLLEGVFSKGESVTFQDVPMLFYRQGKPKKSSGHFATARFLLKTGVLAVSSLLAWKPLRVCELDSNWNSVSNSCSPRLPKHR